MPVTLYQADCLSVLPTLPDNSIHCILTDPPYGLSDHSPEDVVSCLQAWISGQTFDPNKRGFMGRCYHPDTEVLTRNGWRLISDVTMNAEIASLNPVSHEIEYVKVVENHSYPHSGNLVGIIHRSAEQIVTDNHNVYADTRNGFRLMKPCELTSQFHLLNQGFWKGSTPTTVSIENIEFDSSAFLYFLGLYLGDGYFVTRQGLRKGKPRTDNWFGLTVYKQRKKQVIRKAFQNLNVVWTERTSGKAAVFECYDKPLYRFFKSFGTACDKYIPDWVFDLDANLLENLYKGLIDTDGCKQWGGRQEVFSTSSARLADDFQRLCLHTGRSASKITHTQAGTRIIFGKPCKVQKSYRLPVLQHGKRLYLERDGRQNNVKRIPFEGNVVCLTLERNHIMYVRHNGKPVWSGNSWDQWTPGPEVWRECLRVLKPGGMMLVFAATRSMDLMSIAIRLAGFELRDSIGFAHDGGGAPLMAWLQSQGMPKGQNISKKIDEKAGAERKVVGVKQNTYDGCVRDPDKHGNPADQSNIGKWGLTKTPHGMPETEPATEEAKKWEGWYSTLKPCFEPVLICRKPLDGTLVENTLKHGVCGGYNIDGTRIPVDLSLDDPRLGGEGSWRTDKAAKNVYEGGFSGERIASSPLGRYTSNVIWDGSDQVQEVFDSFGEKTSGKPGKRRKAHETHSMAGTLDILERDEVGYADSGSIARFFKACEYSEQEQQSRLAYYAKASSKDRQNSKHPSVKPIALMRYLAKLICPPGGTILDPFAGSGTTGQAAVEEGFNAIIIEREQQYADDCRKRLVLFLENDYTL